MELPVTETVGRLGGLNAQDVEPPYLTLWGRLAGFQRDAVAGEGLRLLRFAATDAADHDVRVG